MILIQKKQVQIFIENLFFFKLKFQDCYPLYKKLKKVAKFLTESQEAQNAQDWGECVSTAQKVLKNEPNVAKIR